MKTILLTLLTLVLVQPAFSAHHEGDKGAKFEERKAKVLERIGKRIALNERANAALKEFQTCVNGAQKGGIKTCHQNHKPKMEAIKAERQAMKAQRKAMKGKK